MLKSNKELYLSSFRSLATNRFFWVSVEIINSNRQMELSEIKTTSGLVERLVGIVLGGLTLER